MPKEIHRDEVQRLVTEDAQIVEVLGPSQYDQMHLPRAINIPLRKLDQIAPETLQRGKTVVVYCFDYQ